MPMKKPEVKPLRPGVSPALDIVRKSTLDQNIERAKISSSIAVREGDSPAVQLGTRGGNQTLGGPSAASAQNPTGSVFVLLEGDLDDERRVKTVRQVEGLSQDILWQGNTATVELELDRVNDLLRIPGVSYADMSQPICAPDPIGGKGQAMAPDKRLREIATWAKKKGTSNGHDYGSGVLVGIIDVGGFDFAHRDFLDKNGGTRWESIWDQGGTHRPPPSEYQDFSSRIATRSANEDATTRPPFGYGSEIRKKHMDRAIAGTDEWQMPATQLEPQSQMIPGSHGTHVASIAAGNHGVARKAKIAGVLVALEESDDDETGDKRDGRSRSFYDSRRIIDAVEYLLAVAERLGTTDESGHTEPLPIAINISLGTNGHAHDASSPVARWIDKVLSTRSRCVTVSAGNSGQTEPESRDDRRFITGRIHASNRFAATNLTHELGWIVEGGVIQDFSENEMEVWYPPGDRINVQVRTPIRQNGERREGGVWLPVIEPNHCFQPVSVGNGTMISVYSETYHPHNGQNRITIKLSPADDSRAQAIDPGEWKVRLTGVVVRDGRYDAWIQRDNAVRLNGSPKRWRYPSHFAVGSFATDGMVNSLAAVERVISVANVDSQRNCAHVTSSRGPTRDGKFKPDIGADGTDVVAARSWDDDQPWMTMTGTSMASPYVAGVAALMLALSRKLTAAQIQGIVVTTSDPLPGHDFQWRSDTGFGVINADRCLQITADFRAVLDTQ
jgi:subtilisin family serine protease